MLKISNLKVKTKDSPILNEVNLSVEKNKIHVLMGPNGSGKSTLAMTLMGHPHFEPTQGKALFNGKNILKTNPQERAKEGIFLSFQYPSEIPGVTISNFLRMIYNKSHEQNLSPMKFRKLLKEKMDLLEIDDSFVDRYLNEGFSGGEKKRMEMLQMLVLEPKMAILDEVDSGLDIDALKVVAKAINTLKKTTEMGVLLITHYTRILKYIEPDKVHIMQNGKIMKEGGRELAHELEDKGYAPFGE